MSVAIHMVQIVYIGRSTWPNYVHKRIDHLCNDEKKRETMWFGKQAARRQEYVQNP